MNFYRQILFIARIEARFFVLYPRLLVAALAVALIPAVYAIIYLSSVWDPASNTGALPVAVVNLDSAVTYREHVFNIGNEVVTRLKSSGTFGYQDFDDEALARQRVREGKLAFALIIPSDFSSNALPGAQAGAGKLVIYTSEGNNFEAAGLARRFAGDLGHAVNESLNERRWALVLNSAAGSERSVSRLREGAEQLRKGASELSDGASQNSSGAKSVSGGARKVNEGVGQLTDGMKQLGSGLRAMDAKRPRNTDLDKLKSGAETLAAGHTELTHGIDELQAGGNRLHAGMTAFRDEARDSLFVPGSVADGLGQLTDGMTQLNTGLQQASDAQQKLSDGAKQVNIGVTALTTGMRTLSTGIRTAVTKLPEDPQLDALAHGTEELARGTGSLADGSQKLKAGALRLQAGINLLADSLPSEIQPLDGSAQGLANSVEPVVEVHAAVANNGSGFASNVVPGALWLGAGIAAFLIHVRVLPRKAQKFSRPAQMIGKLLIPGAVVLLQAGLVLLTLIFVLKIKIVSLGPLALTLAVAAATFLIIVYALTRAFGDAGKALAMVFLAVQLSSSGGILPVELSGGWFANISPWLPLTWVVQAIKASMFGAYDGEWLRPLGWVALAGLLIAMLACYVGRWRYVRTAEVRPAVSF
jgi:putative membrane protein